MLDGEKRCSCDEGHSTFGACMRAKNYRLGRGVFEAGNPALANSGKIEKRVRKYAEARKQGIQPDGTRVDQVERAVKMSDKVGKAYDANSPTRFKE